jgi:general secretion pathway protein M
MKDWWFSRSSQDRMAITITACVVGLLLVYLFVWLPFNNKIITKRNQVESQMATLEWMEKSAEEVRSLRSSQARSNTKVSNEALLTLVDRTAKQNQLSKYIQRLKPQDNDSVQLWLEQAPFDALVQWIGLLVRQYNIDLDAISIERDESSGMVDARLTLLREST